MRGVRPEPQTEDSDGESRYMSVDEEPREVQAPSAPRRRGNKATRVYKGYEPRQRQVRLSGDGFFFAPDCAFSLRMTSGRRGTQ